VRGIRRPRRSAQPEARVDPAAVAFAADVRQGLGRGRKELPSKYLYDAIGTELFEVITLLPEYGLSHAGRRLLRKHAADIVSALPGPVIVAELGSGSAKKTRWILEALSNRQHTRYFPIDISATALERSRFELGRIPSVSLVGFENDYLDGLEQAADRRREGDHLMVLFLGSTIGNFDRSAGESFLRAVRARMEPGDSLLLAADLEKPVAKAELAYNDPLGVTAAFNLNLLARINRELDGCFDLSKFEHHAPWNAAERRIEMHLRARRAHTVEIAGAGIEVAFAEGETIWTESCHKFNTDEIRTLVERAGFRLDGQWLDRDWGYSQNLCLAV
jgi:dimethylhistidine N-methyltransferase